MGFNVKNTHGEQYVEWTTEGRIYIENSPDFEIGGARCWIKGCCEIDYEEEILTCNAYLCARDPLPPIFEIVTYRSGKLWYKWTLDFRRTGSYEIRIFNATWYYDPSEMDIECLRFEFNVITGTTDHAVDKQKELPDNSSSLNSLVRDLSQLYQCSSDHDVKLRCDGQVLSAHKMILSSRSEVLKAMFQTDMRENQTGIVDVTDLAPSTLQEFLRYLYTGTLPDLTFELAVQLYEAGDKYAVNALKECCSEFLKAHLDNDNVCKILLLADAHSDQDFKKCIFGYIAYREIPKKWNGWRDFTESHPKLALEALNHYALEK